MLLCKLAACHKKKITGCPYLTFFVKEKKNTREIFGLFSLLKNKKKQKQDSEPIWLDWAVISGLCDIVLG